MIDPIKSLDQGRKQNIAVLLVNGKKHEFEIGRDIDFSDSLAKVLREKLGYTGLKIGCNEGSCGACTVLMNNRAVLSCMILAVDAQNAEIQTIEGLSDDDPVIKAMAEQSDPGYGTALQCGYCTPGFVMSIKGLLNENPNPSIEEVKEGLSGNLCRCGCYSAIGQAVLNAVEENRESRGKSK